METYEQDLAAFAHIQKLAAEEHKLFEAKTRTDSETKRLKHLQVQLDQCWDVLRQRRAARDKG